MFGGQSSVTRAAWVCAAALAVFATWIATDANANLGIGFFYIVPIGLAAWWGPRSLLLFTFFGCIALYNLGALIQPIPDHALTLVVRVVAFAGVAVVVSTIKSRLDLLERSADTTRQFELPGLTAAVAIAPSESEESADFYLFTNGPDRSTVAIVGRVLGGKDEHRDAGAPLVKARFAALLAETTDPALLLFRANAALISEHGANGRRVAAACLRFQPGPERLSWALAGHPGPLLLPRLQELGQLAGSGPLGSHPGLKPQIGHSALGQGEGVVVYTQSALALRRAGASLGREGFSRLIKPLVLLPVGGMAAQAKQTFLDWTDEPLREDLWLLVMKAQGRPDR